MYMCVIPAQMKSYLFSFGYQNMLQKWQLSLSYFHFLDQVFAEAIRKGFIKGMKKKLKPDMDGHILVTLY